MNTRLMRLRRIALLLVVIGIVLLPAPLYLSWTAQANAPPPQTSQVYFAEPLDPGNATDRETLVYRHKTSVALSVHQVSEQYSAGQYQSPTETAQTLEAAMESGSASTDDDGAQADLRAIARNYSVIYDAYGETGTYYRLAVVEDGAEVRATEITKAQLVARILDQGVYEYDSLSPGAQETVDRIIEKTADDGFGYRPTVDDPFVDRLPALVEKDGTRYSLYVGAHVDDLGPGFGAAILGLIGTGIGSILIIVGTPLYLYAWWRDESG